MRFFKLSKKDVLSLYIRELPLILHQIKISRDNEIIDKLNDKLLQLQFLTVTAGMIPDIEAVTKIRSSINEQLDKFFPKKEEDKKKQDPYDQLRSLQQKISQKSLKRR